LAFRQERQAGAEGWNAQAAGPRPQVRLAPSIELIYRLADPGKIADDPALYLETTERGVELCPRYEAARGLAQLVKPTEGRPPATRDPAQFRRVSEIGFSTRSATAPMRVGAVFSD
jgi:hypothetical protein